MTNKRSSLSAVSVLLIASCIPSMTMEEHFRQMYVEQSIGFTIEDLTRYEFSGISTREPSQVRRLSNGDIMYVFHDFFSDRPCTLYLRVNSATKKVTDGHSEGKGCYQPF